jgi:hypothetical protein
MQLIYKYLRLKNNIDIKIQNYIEKIIGLKWKKIYS